MQRGSIERLLSQQKAIQGFYRMSHRMGIIHTREFLHERR
jgi:hypothetical protein